MNDDNLVERIADKNFNVNEFVKAVLDDENIRGEVIKQLLTNNDIMVYYHCYYIISKASEKKPELFYKYWNNFVSLLEHKNSYHRNIGLTIIANLTKIDEDNLFSSIFQKYIEHFNDDKFMTAQCFVQSMKKVIRNKKQYEKKIIDLLLDIDKICTYREKQKELLKSDIIEVLDEVYKSTKYKDIIVEFIRKQCNSLSPKTKKKARFFLAKHDL
ncbi:hypothetical protein [Paramaledivibacter caminithermalis]|jgi:hypothetical protein|uniref:DNA alkylation repair enzyme n=1 Tax=Paramaledivibacter caminithermalis (strain DSM 15212 / CIP 107654 / DViRD3) TaxID=1121301 RepID=A0A1M6PVU4_PARC5|nr:hypothetical protein [Paramaledivibacter caminithermalis]SHK12085.1 hypothetical protein SAMN02745912_02319 [Paramaledivibacter caminithermalis DSM 15212]